MYFVTSNKLKLKEIKDILPDIKQLEVEIPEIQELDANKIIEFKLNEVGKSTSEEFFVEDTSLYLSCLNGLPGPLIKWFLESLGGKGIYEVCLKMNNFNAEARTLIGYSDKNKNKKFFSGVLKGSIVSPRGDNKFGWNSIFVPEGFDKTFAEISIEEKNKISMRSIAVNKLKEYLENND